jgi:hypothetical protein
MMSENGNSEEGDNVQNKSLDPRSIKSRTSEIMGVSAQDVEIPFELTCKDFLDFASEDLKGQSVRDTVNALSNIKRSIDCLFDSLLFAVGFLEDSKRERWAFPAKMTFLSEIGIITPYILGRINSSRNLLEHEFRKPNRLEVETAYDVATLLFYATFRFTRRFFNFVDISLEYEDRPIALEIKIHEDRTIDVSNHRQTLTVKWSENPENYKEWLKIVYGALSVD